MNGRNHLAALMVTVSLLGCTTSSSSHVVTVTLVATQQNPGQIANTVLASQGEITGFSFFISGVPSGASLPLRLYSFVNKGSCQQPGPLAYALNDRVNTQRSAIRGWTFSRNAPVALPALLSADYFIVVRSAPSDGNVDIFCGDIKPATQ
ncbi:hypothetical protein D3C76_767970 [compost metagenome]